MKLTAFLLFTSLLLSAVVLPVEPPAISGTGETPSNNITYTAGDLRKLNWLAGDWATTGKSKQRLLYMFHGTERLEVMDLRDSDSDMASWFTWRDGRYYFGKNQQWVVTWIGNKDIRFDPVQPNVDAMTWTRQGNEKWYCVKHRASGDQVLLFERQEQP